MNERFLGERLAKLREAKGVSAREMSLAIGQSANYINKIENQKAYPSMGVFFYICEYLDVTPRDFFDEDTASPKQLAELIADLKKLDAQALAHLSGIVRGLTGKR